MTTYSRNETASIRFLLPALLITFAAFGILIGIDASDLRQWLDRSGVWAPAAFVVVGVLAMTLFVPKTVVSLVAGALFGTMLGSLLLLLTAVTAAALNYSIGRWWLHDSIQRRLAEAEDTERIFWIRAIRDVASAADFRLHLLIRLAPIPTTIISYTMGASGSRPRPFLLAAAVAVLPQSLWVHGGTAATLIDDPSASPLRWCGVILSLIAAVGIAMTLPKLAMERVKSMKQLGSGALD